jgi:hypothetical protein
VCGVCLGGGGVGCGWGFAVIAGRQLGAPRLRAMAALPRPCRRLPTPAMSPRRVRPPAGAEGPAFVFVLVLAAAVCLLGLGCVGVPTDLYIDVGRYIRDWIPPIWTFRLEWQQRSRQWRQSGNSDGGPRRLARAEAAAGKTG